MSRCHAAELFKAVTKDQTRQYKLEVMNNPKIFIQVASARGYKISEDTLEHTLNRLSEDELASILNPGVGSRKRLIPR
jgi:hypothetical protein